MFRFKHSQRGYYQIQVLDANDDFYSGDLGWVDYTANTEVSISISGTDNTGYYLPDSGECAVVISGRDLFGNENSIQLEYYVVPSGYILVYGAGSNIVNGLYKPDTSTPDFFIYGSLCNVYYAKEDDSGYYITTDGAMPASHIHYGADGASYIEYYNSVGVTSMPPVSSGRAAAGSGGNPAPSFAESP